MKPRTAQERALPLSEDLVREVLAGTKTQHRFPIKPQPPKDAGRAFMQVAAPTSIDTKPGTCFFRWEIPKGISAGVVCPWGQPGDYLWVQEKFGYDIAVGTSYRSDYVIHYAERDKQISKRWQSATQMTRKESRITLEIKAVAAKKLSEITEDEVKKEGFPKRFFGLIPGHVPLSQYDGVILKSWTETFFHHWDLRHKKNFPSTSDPWCWVVDFIRIDQTKGAIIP